MKTSTDSSPVLPAAAYTEAQAHTQRRRFVTLVKQSTIDYVAIPDGLAVKDAQAFSLYAVVPMEHAAEKDALEHAVARAMRWEVATLLCRALEGKAVR